MSNREEILYTTKYGIYYNPASSHYNKPLVNVICDNCHKENLKSCIGYGNCDICLSCTDKINNNSYFPSSPFPSPSYDSTGFPSGSMCFSVPTLQ